MLYFPFTFHEAVHTHIAFFHMSMQAACGKKLVKP